VAVEPTDALKKDVCRAKIRNEVVGVQVEGLLDGLGGDHHTTSSRSFLAEACFKGLVEGFAVWPRIACMVRRYRASALKQQGGFAGGHLNGRLGLHAIANGITYDQDFESCLGGGDRQGRDCRCILEVGRDFDPDLSNRFAVLNCDAGGGRANQWIRGCQRFV
jgi:hypothetical protein